MDTGSIGLKVLEILSPVLLAALTWASAKLAQLIRAKVQNEYLKGVLVRLDDAVFSAVKKPIKEKAMAAVKSRLGATGRAGGERCRPWRRGAPFGTSAGRVSEPLTRAGDTTPTDAPVVPWRPQPLFLDPLVSRVDDQFRRAGELEPGYGKIDLFSYLQPDRVGGAVDYAHRITKSLSAFGQGWAGMARDPFDRWQADYGALGGVRFQW